MKVRKYIELSLQHEEEVKKAIDFNKKNNYEYLIKDDNSLINYKNLAYLLRIGYELMCFSDTVLLKHKNYNEKIEDIIE